MIIIINFYFLIFSIQIFLKKGNERVDKINPKVGTIAFKKGFVTFAEMKNKTITK